MASKSGIIKKYNIEYAKILESLLGENIEKLLNATEIQLLYWAGESGNISIPPYKSCTSLQSIFLSTIKEIDDFWKSYGLEYLEAVRELEGSSILAEEYQSYLGVFFDTVFIQDNTLSIRNLNVTLNQKFLHIGVVLRGLVRLLPLLKSDSEFPVIALIPISFQSDQFFCPYTKYSIENIDIKKVQQKFKETLGLVSKRPQELSAPYYGVMPDKDGNVTLDNLYDVNGFLNLFGYPDSIPQIDFKTTTLDINKQFSQLNNRPCKIPFLTYDTILRNIWGHFGFMEAQDKLCEYFKSDRSILNSFAYRKRIEIESKGLVFQ